MARLVIRLQWPLGKAVFVTLEDEYGHIPLILWPAVYERYGHVFKEPLVVVQGTVSRRDETMNIVVESARPLIQMGRAPTRNWTLS